MRQPTRSRRAGAMTAAVLAAVAVAGCAGADPADPGADVLAETTWDDIVQEAQGQTVDLWMYGGDTQGNTYIDDVLAPAAEDLGVTLRRVPIADTKEALNRVLAEQQAGRDDGSVDLVWVNGDNFRTGQQAGVWECDWVSMLPNAVYLDPEDPLLRNDFGVPTDGCEAPWHKAQFTLVYNAAVVADPPTSFVELLDWVRANPGRFTYPAPPDFTGSVFVRQALYAVSGGADEVPLEFSQASYDELAPELWSTLSELSPSLWRGGSTYPRDQAELDELYAGGQVDMTMTYGPATLTGLVERGSLPPETKILTLNEGTVGNASFLGLPVNANDSAAAKVVANLAMSPEQQVAKADPAVWGQFTVLDLDLLAVDARADFDALPASKVVPTYDVLSRNADAELSSEWVGPIDTGWRREVLGAG